MRTDHWNRLKTSWSWLHGLCTSKYYFHIESLTQQQLYPSSSILRYYYAGGRGTRTSGIWLMHESYLHNAGYEIRSLIKKLLRNDPQCTKTNLTYFFSIMHKNFYICMTVSIFILENWNEEIYNLVLIYQYH